MSTHKFRVIVADDEKLIAKNIALHITRANPSFEVAGIVGDGQEALELTQKLMPDVVFSDIKMPVIDGLELIAEIHERFPLIKTVIISGYNDFSLVRAALQQHTLDYLLKPVNPDELKSTLQKLERELLASKKELSADRESPREIVERVKAYLRFNYNNAVSFTDMAAQYGFSLSYLTKIFKEHAGMSPGKYLKQHQMNMAKKLLIESNLSIKEIGEKAGYSDQFHFSKVFKKITGVSPRQYRFDSQQKSPVTD